MEENKIDLGRIRDEVSLVSFLQQQGHLPIRHSGGEYFYLSMLRDNDTAPSFCVNEKMGLWYDHGLAKGGSIIDLALQLWPALTFRQAMEKLLDSRGQQSGDLPFAPLVKQTELPLRLPSYLIRSDSPLGGNAAIAKYLAKRGILQVAGPFLRELYYSVKTHKGERREMFAAGWQNQAGGWEVRNEYFKGCLGKKAMSVVPGAPWGLVVFEGMMDFLSWKLEHPTQGQSVLILNSVAFLNAAIDHARPFSSVEVYFDHDPSGRKATQLFLSQVSAAVDRSDIYKGHNDYNERIQYQMASGPGIRDIREQHPYRPSGR